MLGYSEHNSPNTAVDLINQNGISGNENNQTVDDFVNLPEFSWLLKNANKFHFYLSYPPDNPCNMAFEPWRWHWENK